LKYIGKGRAEMVSMLAEYWYGGGVKLENDLASFSYMEIKFQTARIFCVVESQE